MVGLSVILFVMYVNSTLRLMRVGHVVDLITAEALRVVAGMPLDVAAQQPTGVSATESAGTPVPEHVGDPGPEPGDLGPETARFAHHGRAGVLRDINIARLVRMARQHGVVLRLIPRTGDFVVPGTPVIAVHGGPAGKGLRGAGPPAVRGRRTDLPPGPRVRAAATVGHRFASPVACSERSHHGGTGRGPHRAVPVRGDASPARRLAAPGPEGAVRLVQPVPGWAELVDLAFTEIRGVRGVQPSGHPPSAGRARRSPRGRSR